MTDVTLGATVDAQIAAVRPRDIALALLTYNNADTVETVVETARLGLEKHFPGASAVLVNSDAGSSDGTPALLAGAGLPTILAPHEAPASERVAVPFHGVPGRGAALRTAFTVAHRLGVRTVVLLEADVVSITDEWVQRLTGPVWDENADLVSPAYMRHRYDGTITNLLISPLIRALYGRRLRQPLGGAAGLSARLVEHLLIHPKWAWRGRDMTDLWVAGTAIADGFSVWEAWLGPRVVHSRTRTSELPAMIAQTLGAAFTVMDRHQDLWLEVRGSEPVPTIGTRVLPSIEPVDIDVARLVDGFRLGLRDLVPIWEQVLSRETLGDLLMLDVPEETDFRFPDTLWARLVYEFALAHHYAIVHRDHLLRSLVPLYLGRTAAFVLQTRTASAQASEAMLDDVGAAFEREKPYLVERWR